MIKQQAIADPYWSRESSQAEIVEREDPVLWGNTFQALGREKASTYERDGFLFESQLFDESETAALMREARRLTHSVDRKTPGLIIEPDNDAIRSIFRIHRISDVFRRMVQDPRIVDVVREMLGSEVYVHQTRINYKPAFDGKEFFWHSDFETWHIEDGMPRMRAVSVSINLTENNEFNGPLMVVPQSHWSYVRCVGSTPENHHEKSLRRQEFGVPNQEAMQDLVDRGGITAGKGPGGSAMFFECNLMHGSSSNLTPYPRTNLFLVYNSVENAATEPFGGMPPRPEYLAERDIVPVADL